MIKIRQNVFETNSSSTHAICIFTNNPSVPERVDIKVGAFGWDRVDLTDPEEQLSYLYTYLTYQVYGETYDARNPEKIKKAKKEIGVIQNDLYDRLSKLGCNAVFESVEETLNCYENFDAYIDHDEDMDTGFVKFVINHLDDYLSNDSVIMLGNDNNSHYIFEKADKLKEKVHNMKVFTKGN